MKKIIVIGAGPAGLMAAIEASQKHEVVIIEKNSSCGRKLLLTGNGRCNVTNNKSTKEFLNQCSPSSKFLYSAFSQFDIQQLIHFFESRHCPLVEEDKNRMFPASQKAQSILDVLLKECLQNHVEINFDTTVESLIIENEQVMGVQTSTGEIKGNGVIVATGGRSFPLTGSSGDGYKLLSNVGHTITNLYGVEVPLICQDELIQSKRLQGLSLQEVKVKVLLNQKVIKEVVGDLLFTHFGFSGPAILECSQWVSENLSKGEVTLSISSTCRDEKTLLDSMVGVSLSQWMKAFGPKRWVDELIDGYDGALRLDQMSRKDKLIIISRLLNKSFKIQSTLPIDRAFVSAGGIKTSEINPKTLQSKLVKNVAICGELLDCHGPIGGYNLTIAMISGVIAGRHIGE